MRFITLFPPLLMLAVIIMMIGGAGLSVIKPLAYAVLLLMTVSTWLMIRKKWIGCVFGMAAGVLMIWTGIQNNEALMAEWPAGAACFLFYMLAGYVINLRHPQGK